MKSALFPACRRSLLLSLVTVAFAGNNETYFWTGLGNGWRNQQAPSGSITDTLVFGDAPVTRLDLTSYGNTPGMPRVDFISLTSGEVYYVDASSPITLTILGGFKGDYSGDNNALRLGTNVNLELAGNPVFSTGSHALSVAGIVGGSPDSVSLVGPGLITFNNVAGNTYTGPTTLGSATEGTPAIFSWNHQPFGTGNVSVHQGGNFSFFTNQAVTNHFTFNTGAAGTVSFRSYGSPLTFSGNIALANNTTFAAGSGAAFVPFANRLGMLPIPGALSREPIVFTGNISESGGIRSLTLANPGITILMPTIANTYTGGTTVNGTAIFGNNAALPSLGTIQVGSANTSFVGGYAGTAVVTPGNFATFLAKLSPTSSGAVGVDTLPGSNVATLADNINLQGFTTSATNGIRLGTATQAIITGNITPQGNNYHFGNGGGTLSVQSALGNLAGASSLVMNNSNAVPLKLFLQGTLSYTGDTIVNNGFVILDKNLPGGGLQTTGSSTAVGGSYLGKTANVDSSVATFLGQFNKSTTWGIIGFDTRPGDALTVVATPIDLAGFHDGVFLGTATQALLSGDLKPSTVTNTDNRANTLRLTAGNGGTLTVASVLSDITVSTDLNVMLGSPASNEAYSSGTVILTGNNSYSGTTFVNATGITVGIGHDQAFGDSLIHLRAGGANASNAVGFKATTAGIEVANDIDFDTGVTLHVLGNEALTFSGELAGIGSLQLQKAVGDPLGSLTLSHNNPGFSGDIQLQNFDLRLTENLAAGRTTLRLFDANSSVFFEGNALAPVIHGIYSDLNLGRILLQNGATLTFDTSDDAQDHQFGGVISSLTGGPTTASVVITSTAGDLMHLYGANHYSGGTTVTNAGVLHLGHDAAAGTGPVVVNAPDGGLLLSPGVTLNNNLTFIAGGIGGYGTLSPGNLSVLTIGVGQMLAPGSGGGLAYSTGTLTVDLDAAFVNGGTYRWSLQDATTLEGASHLLIRGNLDLTALSPGGFVLALESLTLTGDDGWANLVAGTHYQFTLLTTTGAITGFSADKFTIDASEFQLGSMSASEFVLSSNGQQITIAFAAVPEPSTWALIATGALGLACFRRRRAA